jgi:hypothetical protein
VCNFVPPLFIFIFVPKCCRPPRFATGPHLYEIYPHGCTSVLSYSTMGSGSLAAMSVLENEYKDDLTEEEAKALVHKVRAAAKQRVVCLGRRRGGCCVPMGFVPPKSSPCVIIIIHHATCLKAILAGIFNDLGSGSSVDLRVLRKDYTQYYRRMDNPNEVAPLRAMVKHSGALAVLLAMCWLSHARRVRHMHDRHTQQCGAPARSGIFLCPSTLSSISVVARLSMCYQTVA